MVAIVRGPRSTDTALAEMVGAMRGAMLGEMVGIRVGTLIVGVRMIACACATSTPRQAAIKSAAPTDEA
ncbi:MULTISPECIES: hypothetical protein [Bradyrhizobium]|uniref:hypothetical protein n=1 Tax=Bradyrhizobium TaxID=374 RepID=UPI0032E4894B